MSEHMDYTALHACPDCDSRLRLFPYPVDGGWIAATVCACRRGGLPRRYSTETDVLATFDAAERAISDLLSPTEELEGATT